MFVEFHGDLVEFSWDFRGSQSLLSKHILSLSLLANLRAIFVDPLKPELVALPGCFRGLFVDVTATPAVKKRVQPYCLGKQRRELLA